MIEFGRVLHSKASDFGPGFCATITAAVLLHIQEINTIDEN
jgi:hypothetical protein